MSACHICCPVVSQNRGKCPFEGAMAQQRNVPLFSQDYISLTLTTEGQLHHQLLLSTCKLEVRTDYGWDTLGACVCTSLNRCGLHACGVHTDCVAAAVLLLPALSVYTEFCNGN